MYDALEPLPLGIATITRPSPSLPMHEMEVEELETFIQVVGEGTALPGPFAGKVESTVTPGTQFRKRCVVTLFGQDTKSAPQEIRVGFVKMHRLVLTDADFPPRECSMKCPG